MTELAIDHDKVCGTLLYMIDDTITHHRRISRKGRSSNMYGGPWRVYDSIVDDLYELISDVRKHRFHAFGSEHIVRAMAAVRSVENYSEMVFQATLAYAETKSGRDLHEVSGYLHCLCRAIRDTIERLVSGTGNLDACRDNLYAARRWAVSLSEAK